MPSAAASRPFKVTASFIAVVSYARPLVGSSSAFTWLDPAWATADDEV
jgi:hypothetical protein